MEQMSRNIGFQLKRFRGLRGLSLDDVAKATGVSKAQLAQIEKGEANPTVSTIWKIATGLKVSFSTLMQPSKEYFQKYGANAESPAIEEDGKYRVYSIVPYDPKRGWELYKVEIDPGVIHKSEAHPEGVEETITVIKGQAVIQCGDMKEVLNEGETLIFSGHQSHQYENLTKDITMLYLIIQYQ